MNSQWPIGPFPKAPREYDEGYLNALVRAIEDTLTRARSPGVIEGTLRYPVGLVSISTLSSTSGTTVTLTNIPSDYRQLYIELDGVSFNAAATLSVAVSADNGSTFGTAEPVSSVTAGAASLISGVIHIDNLQTTELGCVARPITFVGASAATRFQQTQPLAGNATAIGPYNAIQFSGGTFDAGSIRVFGIA